MRLPLPDARSPRLACAVLLLALLLRLGRVLLRWDEVALAYAAYQVPLLDALSHPARIPGLFVGLHPPLYGLLLALLERLAPVPLLFLGLSGLLSLLATWAALRAASLLAGPRAGLLAGLLAAGSPLLLHYAAELNDYPLASAEVAGLAWAWARWRRGGGLGPLLALGVAASWTHLLAGAVAGLLGLAVLLRAPREGARLLLLLALGASPVLAGALRLAGDAHTFGQPPLLLAASWADWRSRFGPFPLVGLGLGLLGLGLGALRPALALLGAWLGLLAAIVLFVLLGVAAPHQFPYWSLLAPLGAALLGVAGARRPALLAAGLLLALAQLAVASRSEASGLVALWRDQARERAVDRALARARPGDAIWLVSPALEPDDDKRATSAVLWRFRPWRPMPVARPFPFDYTDYRYGQPRRYGDIELYTFTDFWPARMDAVLDHYAARGRTVWIALYDYAPARDYPGRLHHLLRPWRYTEEQVGEDRGLGVDLLVAVRGLRGGA